MVNIYNALKPSEVNKIYEDNKISPLEAKIMDTVDYKLYKNKQIIDNIILKTSKNVGFGVINDMPKLDIKQRFKASIKSS